jgi:hypothetical protein
MARSHIHTLIFYHMQKSTNRHRLEKHRLRNKSTLILNTQNNNKIMNSRKKYKNKYQGKWKISNKKTRNISIIAMEMVKLRQIMKA